jgi:hypothetical protein
MRACHALDSSALVSRMSVLCFRGSCRAGLWSRSQRLQCTGAPGHSGNVPENRMSDTAIKKRNIEAAARTFKMTKGQKMLRRAVHRAT